MANQAVDGSPTELESPPRRAYQRLTIPSEQDWVRMRPRIHHLYIEMGHTCPEVRKILGREGFHASDRMFKGRFARWGYDRKTIKDVEYEAMLMIYEHHLLQGEQVDFTVAHGQGRKSLSITDIKKHLIRANNGSKAPKNHRAKLEQEGYPYHATRARKAIEFSIVHMSFANTSASSSPERSGSSCMEHDDSDLLSDSDQEAERASGNDLLPPPLFTGAAEMDFATWQPERIPQRSVSILKDLNLSDRFQQLYLSAPLGGQTPVSHDIKTSKAEQWVYHVFMTCILTDRPYEGAGNERRQARQCFAQMLREANPHLLSSLFHISAVLSSLGRDGEYRKFLEDCCEVMSEENVPLNYMTPYRYALACETGNYEDIKKYSQNLELCTRYCCELYGEDSPTVVVSLHFQASHLIDQMDDPQTAIPLLQNCLVRSEDVVDRNHLININCIALLARAHKKQGEAQSALVMYTDISERCKNNPVIGARHPCRLRFLRELAILQAEMGLLAEAEKNMVEVLSGRRYTLGHGHHHTFSALETLEGLLLAQNRAHEGHRLRLEIIAAYQSAPPFTMPREAFFP